MANPAMQAMRPTPGRFFMPFIGNSFRLSGDMALSNHHSFIPANAEWTPFVAHIPLFRD